MEQAIIDFVQFLSESFGFLFVTFFNVLIDALALVLSAVLGIFPDFTVPTVASIDDQYKMLQVWNMFFPTDMFIIWFSFWSISEGTWLGLSPVLRWFKVIGN